MFSKDIMQLLMQVVSSWQVIAVTIALVLYMNIIFHVARTGYYRPRAAKKMKVKKVKAQAAESGPEEVVSSPGASVNDELGLEEV